MRHIFIPVYAVIAIWWSYMIILWIARKFKQYIIFSFGFSDFCVFHNGCLGVENPRLIHGSIHAFSVYLLLCCCLLQGNRCDDIYNGMGGIIKWLFQCLLERYSDSWDEFVSLDTKSSDDEEMHYRYNFCAPQRTW
jgi:hypothetical protein